jgi:Immunity protein 8
MIRAKIKALEITEAPDLNPSAYAPNNRGDFACTFGLTIGPNDGDGGELFYLTVCTPTWLAKECEKDGFVWGRHRLIVPEYNLKAITAIITKFVERCSGESWQEAASKLSRIASWEFEDYAS